MLNKREDGTAGEVLAVEYLQKKGYRILERNYRFERAEVDIIAEDQEFLVFVEVKARRSTMFGEPEDAVTERKSAQMRKVANGYCLRCGIEDRACRFDIIAIRYDGKNPTIRHIENAF